MVNEEKPKKSHKLIIISVFILGISILILYVMDRYVFTKKMGFHYTDSPEYRKRVPDKKKDDDKKVEVEEKKKKITPKTIKPELKRVKIKSIKEIMRILSVNYSESVIADWSYNVEKAASKKLSKSLYSKGELEAWDVDMHGEANTKRLELGVEEFMKKEEEKTEEKPAQEEGLVNDEGLDGNEAEILSSPTPTEKDNEEPKLERIDPFSYRVLRFMPGHGSDGYFHDFGGVDFKGSASGKPDCIESSAQKPDELKKVFLPLGHGGSIVYEITGGELIDGDGPDFVIYGDSVFSDAIETAKIEVALEDNPSSYIEFPCDSVNPPFMNCAGVHPVKVGREEDQLKVGGDAFDLARIGIKKIRFIKITDTGDNKDGIDLLYTDGFDIDSISLIHAYKKQ